MEHLADVLVDQLRKDLNIESPSQVMHEHGRYIGLGLAAGITSTHADIAGAMSALPLRLGPGRVSGLNVDGIHGAGHTVNQNLTVNNNHRPMGPADLVTALNQHAALHQAPIFAGAGIPGH